MPTSTREILLGRYHYDPLDRLVDCTPFEQAAIQRYYCKKRLATERQGAVQRTIVQYDGQLVAQQQRGNLRGPIYLTINFTTSVSSGRDFNPINLSRCVFRKYPFLYHFFSPQLLCGSEPARESNISDNQ
ncbi:hypothetical protein PS914_06848 [Pseudomonas fluorescens]|uniref:hypothetical protein n=1 Tax=Pseudomonas fluorescens TaxID=294 RepID=UPI001253D946|nr:hypothetical protein [Pseudomonas fluorescens]VVQ22871.1 hypothetical protein PS914_06848 [Pseudomonas fluorescens]